LVAPRYDRLDAHNLWSGGVDSSGSSVGPHSGLLEFQKEKQLSLTRIANFRLSRIHRNRQRLPSNGSIERAQSTSRDFTLLRKTRVRYLCLTVVV
jgi:hypothetical protein